MITGTVVIEGSPRGMAKQFRGLVKDGLQSLVKMWHHDIFPGHFVPVARQRYKYETRSIRYTRYKQKKRPMAGPLEFTGRAKKMLTRSIKVTGTAKRAKGSMKAPKYFWMTPAGHPDKPDEATRVTKRETLNMAKMLNRRVTKRLNELKYREVVHCG